MTLAQTPLLPDPPFGTGELQTLLDFIDYYRVVLRRKAEGLTAEELAHTIAPSTMSLGGMMAHLAYVEDQWFPAIVDGTGQTPPWDTAPWDEDNDWDWHWAQGKSPDQILGLYDRAVERSRAVQERWTDPAAVVAGDRGEGMTLRWVLVHLVEEYSRHAGRADLLRESIDGAVGD
ncbi:DinB family protein [Micrococcus terreus]|uniref:DinB family protein n=1 Tax=Micrococcus terreus TaxID=574650 RepID=UPI003015E0DB